MFFFKELWHSGVFVGLTSLELSLLLFHESAALRAQQERGWLSCVEYFDIIVEPLVRRWT